jgi:tetratricopeptide (TPR) repeat protein
LRTQIALWCDKLADEQLNSGHQGAWEKSSRQLAAVLEELVDDFPDQTRYREFLVRHYDRLVRVFRDTGRLEDELDAERQKTALYQKLADRFPSEWRYRLDLGKRQVSLGRHLTNTGRSELAEELFASASNQLQTVVEQICDQPELRRELAQCHQHLAWVHASDGRAQEALSSFHRALELDPNHPWTHARLADFLLTNPEVRNPAQALEHATIAVQKRPDDAKFLVMLGRACYRIGDYAAAVDALEKSVALVDGPANKRFFLAMAHWRLGHEEEARRRYDEGVGLAENYKCTYEDLRRVRAEAAELLGVGEKEEANEPSAAP